MVLINNDTLEFIFEPKAVDSQERIKIFYWNQLSKIEIHYLKKPTTRLVKALSFVVSLILSFILNAYLGQGEGESRPTKIVFTKKNGNNETLEMSLTSDMEKRIKAKFGNTVVTDVL